jgi:signal transduction histidine kinase
VKALSSEKAAQTTTTEADHSARGLRLALMAGFGGIALVFLVATIDTVHLLGTMRDESRLIREAARQRTNHLESIRSSILLTHTYLGDYVLGADQESGDQLGKMRDAWSRLSSDLANYRSSTPDEQVQVKRLGDLLDRHWQYVSRVMNSVSATKHRDTSFYDLEILPLSTSTIEITSQLETIDAKQAASAEAQIQSEFERLGSNLGIALSVGLVAALLLAAGCLTYIFRIERQNNRRYQEILKARGALEQLSARLVNAQELERRTISRELHDQVGQTLNAVLMDVANLAKRIQADDTVSLRYLDNIRTLADSSVNSIRDIALLLRPSMLDDLGLIPALEWQAREVSRRSGVKIKVNAENVSDSLADEMRTCIYRVVQEALNNVFRHSAAKNAEVTVRQDDATLFLSVQDDGCGFDPEKTRGLGMLGMEERVRQLGGKFEVHSSAAKGTVLEVVLPVPVAAV